jgi:hypothetical protein
VVIFNLRQVIVGGVLVALVAIGSFQPKVSSFVAEQWVQHKQMAHFWGAEQERRTHLDRLDTLVMQRMGHKQHIIGELIEGRISLLEAADCFRYFNKSIPEVPCFYQHAFAGSTDNERVCRQVIHWVRQSWNYNGHSAQELREVAKRLEGELDARVKRGELSLPDVAG